MIGNCECCEARAYLEPKRRGGIVLDLCRRCQRRDVIGAWRNEVRGAAQ